MEKCPADLKWKSWKSLTTKNQGVIFGTNSSIPMVTNPVVMVISISVTNKESDTSLIAPTPHSGEILIHQKSIAIYNVFIMKGELD